MRDTPNEAGPMATLPQMIDVLAEIDNREKPTVAQFGRSIREGGFIPGGKRGVGAPQLETQHVASLLLGTFGCESPARAPEVVARYRCLRLHEQKIKKNAPREVDAAIYESSPLIGLIESAANFGEAIENLIDGAPVVAKELVRFSQPIVYSSVPLDEVCAANAQDKVARHSMHALHVTLYERYAYITLLEPVWHNLVGLPVWRADFQALSGDYLSFPSCDRQVAVTFTHNTFFALHQAMNASNKSDAA